MRAYSHLSDRERDEIAILRAADRSLGAIARQLGRAKTTISRELQRNALPSGGYSPMHAAGAYIWRRRRAALLEKDARLQTFVVDRLAEGWSPEQIAGWLKNGAERGLRKIGCETIYAFIYRAGQNAAELWRDLARRRKRRRPPGRSGRSSRIAPRSTSVRALSAPAMRSAIGRGISSSASEPGPCSCCMNANPA